MISKTKLLLLTTVFSISITLGTFKRIVGGKPARVGEFPYLVSLRRSYNDNHFCGGSIITSLHILTAAHCMFYRWGGMLQPAAVSIVAGQLDLPITYAGIYRNATKITTHPDYDKTTLAHDLAIIELKSQLPVNSNKLIDVIPLRINPIKIGTCYVSGWGSQQSKSREISEVLLVTEVNLIDFNKCQTMYNKLGMVLPTGSICAADTNGGKDACEGDSGGPLVCDGQQTGIISTGYGCGEENFPGIYVQAANYYDWIYKQTANYNSKPDSVFESKESSLEHFMECIEPIPNIDNNLPISTKIFHYSMYALKNNGKSQFCVLSRSMRLFMNYVSNF